jgi:hypothetical protein
MDKKKSKQEEIIKKRDPARVAFVHDWLYHM